MKKLILTILVGTIMLCGCSQKKQVNNPYEIQVGGKVLSYYDTQDVFKDAGFTMTDGLYDAVEENLIFPRENNAVMSIHLMEGSVSTYKGISLGDNISKVTDIFQHETDLGDIVVVTFNGNTEVKEAPDVPNECLTISYCCGGSDDVITKIIIADMLAQREFR